MRLRAALACCAAAAAAVALTAQTQTTMPATPQQQPTPQQPTFRTGASLVRVDVTVTDKRGEPATALTADDFEVQEDDVPQTIETFKFVSADGHQAEDDDTSLPIRSREHAAAEAARDNVRVFLIFWDEYHIDRFIPAIEGRRVLSQFVQTSFGPTDLVALMDPLLPTDAIAFTRDFNGLARKIQKLEGRQRVYLPPRSIMEEGMLYRMGDVERLRTEVTISALKAAASFLGALKEGRKSIVLVTTGLPNLDPMDRLALITDLMNTANANNTAIYTVDPRGLTGSGIDDVLRILPDNTGGQAFVNTNAPERLMQRVVRDASAYYLLGYASIRNPVDGKFHKIKVRLKKSGLEVRFRQGYWAPRVSDMTRVARDAASEPPTAVSTALSTLSRSRSERLVDLWTGTSRAADGSTSLTVAWTPRPGVAIASPATVSVVAERDGGRQSREAPVSAQRLVLKTPPGELHLRVLVRDASGQTIDEDARTVAVTDFAVPLAFTSPVVLKSRSVMEMKAIAADPDAVPYAGREFVRTDRLFVRFALHGAAAKDAALTAELLGRAGKSLLPLIVGTAASGEMQIDLPLASVARGDYLIAIRAAAGDERAEALVPFRVN